VLKKLAATAVATKFALLCIASHVPTALATASQRTDVADEIAGSCAAFEAWFLDPACEQLQRAKKIARTRQNLAHMATH
jgi:hypothetical protein